MASLTILRAAKARFVTKMTHFLCLSIYLLRLAQYLTTAEAESSLARPPPSQAIDSLRWLHNIIYESLGLLSVTQDFNHA